MLLSTQTDFLSRRFGDAQALRHIRNVGFDAVDFGMYHYKKDDNPLRYAEKQFEQYFTDLHSLAGEIGLQIGQVHSPFPTYAGDGDDDDRLFMQERAMRAAALLGSPYMVMHPAMPQGCIYDRGKEEAFDINMQRYGHMAALIRETGVKIAIENMFSWDPELGRFCETVCSTGAEMNRYIDALNPPGEELFVACLDVGHSMISGDAPQAMVLQLGRRLKVLHIQDNDGSGDWHVIPGLGKINWRKLMTTLRQVGYPGSFSLESDMFPTAFGEEHWQHSYALMYSVARGIVQAQ